MPTDDRARRSLARWLIPAIAFVAGAVVAIGLGAGQAPQPAPALSVPTFGTASGGAAPQARNSAAAGELALFRDINDKFVQQLRRYETRLRAIAETAEAEGASTSAEDMRDFALETELLIDRYDLILKDK